MLYAATLALLLSQTAALPKETIQVFPELLQIERRPVPAMVGVILSGGRATLEFKVELELPPALEPDHLSQTKRASIGPYTLSKKNDKVAIAIPTGQVNHADGKPVPQRPLAYRLAVTVKDADSMGECTIEIFRTAMLIRPGAKPLPGNLLLLLDTNWIASERGTGIAWSVKGIPPNLIAEFPQSVAPLAAMAMPKTPGITEATIPVLNPDNSLIFLHWDGKLIRSGTPHTGANRMAFQFTSPVALVISKVYLNPH